MSAYGERVARMEEQIKALSDKLETTDQKINDLTIKIDDLLALRNQGVGAFWIASTLVGTSIVGGVVAIFKYILGGP